jgi:VanZ family protein
VERPEFAFLHILIRKLAHLVVYAALSLLWFRARRGPRSGWQRDWALVAILVSMLVAGSDELHQYFAGSRTGTPWDVLLDSLGALLAQALLALRGLRRPHSPA